MYCIVDTSQRRLGHPLFSPGLDAFGIPVDTYILRNTIDMLTIRASALSQPPIPDGLQNEPNPLLGVGFSGSAMGILILAVSFAAWVPVLYLGRLRSIVGYFSMSIVEGNSARCYSDLCRGSRFRLRSKTLSNNWYI